MAYAYYNEIDPEAAQWLRNLIAAGHIAPGEVDERSIEDVHPNDLKPFTQCHFFAGIGGWPLAFRRAGWPDDRPAWSGSCPCQPYSQAGKGGGFDDERHLWPAFQWLIQHRDPVIVVGEQVASSDALPWLDLVQDDLEGMGYAFGAIAGPASGYGAPHIRDRLYWLADANHARLEGWRGAAERANQLAAGPRSMAGALADAVGNQPDWPGEARGGRSEHPNLRPAGALADADSGQCQRRTVISRPVSDGKDAGRSQGVCVPEPCGDTGGAGPVNGFWSDADWILCRDRKWRPIEPGSFPLAYGLPLGMGRLPEWARGLAKVAGLDGASLKRAKAYRRNALAGYGNAVNVEHATHFIRAVKQVCA
jgi:DNA (cytosine-5)-methyltransferase 1